MTQLAEVGILRSQYFKSWDSYQIPMKPTHPISYRETEALVAYYLGQFNEKEQLVRFRKYLKKHTSVGAEALKENEAIDETLYFVAEKLKNEGYSPGRPLSFEQTAGLANYFRAFSREGAGARELELVTVEIFFDDSYVYWSSGRLKSRTMKKRTGVVQYWEYDEAGKEVTARSEGVREGSPGDNQ